MDIQKQIKELQERNRGVLSYYYDRKLTDEEIKELDQLTTDSFNQGALAMIEEMRRVQYGTNGEGQKWVMMNDLEDHLKTLEAKIQEK